ncbi:Acetyltransferase (GNAT) family protein [Bryocella elongata]|uniref:Acetyltransferase (GNAT) family protein n=1 Tax=Bryocella elongata TaxID=863522 RepID=A0A1H5S644_9BACT|nr:GNAT family N-acetyltransferase [Bryocella elongata]SEF46049.1 Acetyltransferase (GNAT) family protein [Bryocella elongata]
MTLRPATPADLPAVLALLDSYYTEFDIWQRDDPAYTAQSLAPTTDGTGYFLAFAPAKPTPNQSPDQSDHAQPHPTPNIQHPTPNTGDIPAACVMLRRLHLDALADQPPDPPGQTPASPPALRSSSGLQPAEPASSTTAGFSPGTLPATPHQPTAVECKRLYVLPAFRGNKLAGPLMDLAEQTARNADHTWIYLDSKSEFQTAIAMYRRRGYQEIPRFNNNPQATIFMRKRL